MKRFGLVFKIWLAMFALVVLVLGLSSIFQSGMIERIYLGQQSESIKERASALAREYPSLGSQADVDREVASLSRDLSASVMVIDPRANVISWSMGRGMGRRGMGMGMGWGRMQAGGPGAPLDQLEIKSVLGGQTLVKRGTSSFFEADVIQVAVPIIKDGAVAGAVLVHSPLAPIQANLRSINEAVIYSLLLGLAAATLLAFVFSRSVTRPIIKINEVARAMAGGDYSLQAPADTGGELGVLAESINTLSRQLREKIEAIERIDSTRRNFVASVSHELRTPLTIMQGYTEALMDGIAEDHQQREKYLMNIYEETIRLGRLVDDLLDLRRMESGSISMRLDRAELTEIIGDVATHFNETKNVRDVAVRADLPREGLAARGDPDRLKQVIINLVDNAVRFSPEGSVVEIRGEGAGNTVKVLVSDRGPGLAPGEKDLVWERLYRGESPHSGRDSGSGLGLAIARQIVELHGGTVGVESAPGKGSTFWFTVSRA